MKKPRPQKPIALPEPVKPYDERENLPSASGMERLYLCRGSFNLESQLSDIADKTLADSGTKIHNALAGWLEPDLLNDDEKWVFERCNEYEYKLLCDTFGEERIPDLEVVREKREWLYSEDDEKQSSGKQDVLYMDTKALLALEIDYKTGYKPVTEPQSNIQLRELAVLTHEEYGMLKVMVAVIQPRCSPPVAMAVYEESDLRYAGKELRVVLEQSKDPKALRTPGPAQCEHCRAKAICPEYQTDARREAVLVGQITFISSKEMDYREELMPGYSLSNILDKVAHIERACKAVREEAKIRLKMGREVPGYQLVKGKSRREITDVYGLYEKIVNKLKWMSIKDFLNNYASFGIGDLDKLAKKYPPKDPSIRPERLYQKRFGEFIDQKPTDLQVERTNYLKAGSKQPAADSGEKKVSKQLPMHRDAPAAKESESVLSHLFGSNHGKRKQEKKGRL